MSNPEVKPSLTATANNERDANSAYPILTGLFWVETVEVFGSNDASRDQVGDVDVCLVYSCRIDAEDLIEQSLAAATASGRNLSYVAAMFFLDSQSRKRLNGRNLDIEFSRTEAIQPIPDPNPQVVCRRP